MIQIIKDFAFISGVVSGFCYLVAWVIPYYLTLVEAERFAP